MLTPTADDLLPTPAVLIWARKRFDSACIIEDGGHVWSWRSMAAAAAMVASRLPNVSGRVVAFSVPNGGAFAAVMFGIWLAGGAPAPVSYRLPAPERAKVLASIEPSCSVATRDLKLEADVQFEIAELRDAVLDDGEALTVPRFPDRAPGIVICTSGTTGTPKAVLHTLRGAWGFIDNVATRPVDTDHPRDPTGKGPSRIDARPMVHSGAIYGLLTTLWRGRPMVSMSRFDPLRYATLVREWEVETLNLVPTMVRMLLDAGQAVGQLSPPARVASSGTAPLPDEWRQEFEHRFGVPVQRTYGSTEVNTVSVEPMEDLLSGVRRPGTSGRVAQLVSVQIRGDQGQVLPNGETGSIWVRSETLVPQVIGSAFLADADGWIDTGDIGCLDDDRYIYLTGRKRELIIRGGLKMVPAEIEGALLEHQAVVEAVVAGIPDPRLGEVPAAWVRVTDPTSSEELMDFVRERLAGYKVPVKVSFVDSYPRTENGKVRKQELVAGLVATQD